MSEKIKEKIIGKFNADYQIDGYGEADVLPELVKKFPDLYRKYQTVITDEAYFIEFNKMKRWDKYEKLVKKFEMYLDGWVQYNN